MTVSRPLALTGLAMLAFGRNSLNQLGTGTPHHTGLATPTEIRCCTCNEGHGPPQEGATARRPWARIANTAELAAEGLTDADLPANLEINRRRLSYADLRTRYAGARLVVMLPCTTAMACRVSVLLASGAVKYRRSGCMVIGPSSAAHSGRLQLWQPRRPRCL